MAASLLRLANGVGLLNMVSPIPTGLGTELSCSSPVPPVPPVAIEEGNVVNGLPMFKDRFLVFFAWKDLGDLACSREVEDDNGADMAFYDQSVFGNLSYSSSS